MDEAMPNYDTQDERRSHALKVSPQKWALKRTGRIVFVVLALLLIALALVWMSREQIAGNIIDDALAQNGLEASYEIESIGAQRQLIRNLVIGDPQAPDFTAERLVVDIVYTLGLPQIDRVELQAPRLYGAVRDGTLSFGALDPLIYADSDEPPGLPALNLAVVDGRARIESEYGVVGAKLDGEGPFDSGFAGTLALTAPGIGTEECSAKEATLYGAVTTDGGETFFDGPLRARQLTCAGAALTQVDIGTAFTLASDFSSVEGTLVPEANGLSYGDIALAELAGESRFTLALSEANFGNLNLSHALLGKRLSASPMTVEELALDGTFRANDSFAQATWEVDAEGAGTALDVGADTLADLRSGVEGTMAEGLLTKLERGLSNSLRNGRFAANATLRMLESNTYAIIPKATLRSGTGETVLALTRVSYSMNDNRLVGNFLTGGTDLPLIVGRMQQVIGGELEMRMDMPEYREGTDWLAIPRLSVRQSQSGVLSFDGFVRAGGAIPGGSVRALELPLEGRFDSSGGLTIGRTCTPLRVAGLNAYQLALDDRTLTLCPVDGQAIASYRDSFNLAAQTQGMELSGQFAGTDANVTAEGVVLRYPGPFEIEALQAVIGPSDKAVRFSATSLLGELGEEIGGTFEGGNAAIDAVPLDLSEVGGTWSFADSVLTIGEGAFLVSERLDPDVSALPRFNPLVVQGAVLRLEDNVIRANADLRHPGSATLITSVNLRHDLTDAIGHADLSVPGIRFSDRIQPADLSELAVGFIAFADGLVSGEGRIDWTSDTIDSSGIFRSDGFDFAAAFGPVSGVKGEVRFTDLLSLTTAPEQKLTIASVNPGIEALGGEIIFSLTEGTTLTVHDGRWPFMGGELILRPTTAVFGGGEGQNYIFEMIALDASTFVTQMEMSNLGATGTFDGTVPIYFDPNGDGFIRGGLLISRPPGGNVAYVGELTYEDMGAIANYAFQSLRSLDYNQMSIELNGSLAGEVLTNFQIDGVRQGEGASENFVTRELAKLPIRFKINVRSDNFFTLAKIMRGYFDPTIFAVDLFNEPLGVEGLPPSPNSPAPTPQTKIDDADRRDEPAVQRSESDDL